jgi:hypothetical protein
MSRPKKVDTTLGDLIVALTDATVPYAQDETEASILVAYLLSDLLDKSQGPAATWH